jgi:hypothetical protein
MADQNGELQAFIEVETDLIDVDAKEAARHEGTEASRRRTESMRRHGLFQLPVVSRYGERFQVRAGNGATREAKRELKVQQQQQQNDRLNGPYFVARCLECIWTIPLRSRCGCRYPGTPGFVCGLLILCAGAGSKDPDPVFCFGIIWLVMLIVRRFQAVSLLRQGVYQHSEYAGFPDLVTRLFPFIESETLARNVEAALCLGFSWLVMQETKPLGGLLLTGAFALTVTRFLEGYTNWSQTFRMRDAAVLQRQHAARYRGEFDEF